MFKIILLIVIIPTVCSNLWGASQGGHTAGKRHILDISEINIPRPIEQGQFSPDSTSMLQTADKIGMASSNLKLTSFNAQGLQGNKKRNKVFHWLKKKG